MAVSEYSESDIDTLVSDVVGEDYMDWEEIIKGVEVRRGGRIAPSKVNEALDSEDYDTRIEGLDDPESELEVLYRKKD